MLAYKHIRLLKRIKKNKIIRTTKFNNDLNYLLELGYIGITSCDKPGDYYAQPYLTEKGEAALDIYLRSKLETWIPVSISSFLSIVAIVISIIALAKP